MTTRQLYITQGIDASKVIADASSGTPAIVHYHSASVECTNYRHRQFDETGSQTGEWGESYGTGDSSDLQG